MPKLSKAPRPAATVSAVGAVGAVAAITAAAAAVAVAAAAMVAQEGRFPADRTAAITAVASDAPSPW
jgi:hypothetical protein